MRLFPRLFPNTAALFALTLLLGCQIQSRRTDAPLPELREATLTEHMGLASTATDSDQAIIRKMIRQNQVPSSPGRLHVDYPRDSCVFPPEFVPPTFMWRNEGLKATRWLIEFALDDSTKLFAIKPTEGPPPFKIDPEIPLTAAEGSYARPDQELAPSDWEIPTSTHQKRNPTLETWTVPTTAWARLQELARERFVRVTVSGFESGSGGPILSGTFRFLVSNDSVGAPIFYRDVPFIPVVTEKEDLRFPLEGINMRYINWRLRDVSRWESKVVLRDMPTCSNCHTFSRDGKWLGMDIDGPVGDKGAYGIQKVSRQMVFARRDVMSWNYDFKGRTPGKISLGFMSSISPNGRFVVSTVNEELYSTGYRDPTFSQVFYPTRGILAIYNRATKEIVPLPGADDTAFVHCSPTWTPDGNSIVFSRAKSKPPFTRDQKMPQRANDPEETQIKSDLYRIPFNSGRGGIPVAFQNASSNGMSNSFAKVTPDGKYVIWVQAKNGLLMRPGSKLWIAPLNGGTPRLMRCNGDVMNSWHSISPNGHWMVFSSKHFSGYTQLFLTHLNGQGGDSPFILLPNSTADNRAANIPEFANIGYDELNNIDVPAVSLFRDKLKAQEMIQRGNFPEAIRLLQNALKEEKTDVLMRTDLSMTLAGMTRDYNESVRLVKESIRIDSNYHQIYFFLGHFYEQLGKEKLAIPAYKKCLVKNPNNYWAMLKIAKLYLFPQDTSLRNLDSAYHYAKKSCDITYYRKSYLLQNLARIFSEQGQFREAIRTDQIAVSRSLEVEDTEHVVNIENEMLLYAQNRKFTSAVHRLPSKAP